MWLNNTPLNRQLSWPNCWSHFWPFTTAAMACSCQQRVLSMVTPRKMVVGCNLIMWLPIFRSGHGVGIMDFFLNVWGTRCRVRSRSWN
ncbi:hypothetical protein FA15DRAFT_737156, partial [Coprinopsis marcescibilis]